MKRTRIERVRAMTAKRPQVTVEVTYESNQAAHESLLDIIVELLDERRKSGRG